MILQRISILNYKNIAQADLSFSPKLNCFIGDNGEGKTNVLDAIHFLSLCKSTTTSIDSLCVRHGEEYAVLQGSYEREDGSHEEIYCGIKRGQKKVLRRNKKAYKRLTEHIGLIPLAIVSPSDAGLIADGSEERRRFMDVVISQYDRTYMEALLNYNKALQQRNALLKMYDSAPAPTVPVGSSSALAPAGSSAALTPVDSSSGLAPVGFPDGSSPSAGAISPDPELLSLWEEEMARQGEVIFRARTEYIKEFVPIFQRIHSEISQGKETVAWTYVSHAQRGPLLEVIQASRATDLVIGYSLHGVHKDELEMTLGGFPIKREGSQGQNKTFLIALKLAQFDFLKRTGSRTTPLLLLDDIFDKLDAERVEQIVRLVSGEDFGQIFITDTNRDHLDRILTQIGSDYQLFHVKGGVIE